MARLLATVAALFVLAGCSDVPREEEDPSDLGPQGAAASAVDLPACDDVWRPGRTLPADYEGCAQGDIMAFADPDECADGSRLHTYDDDLWAFAGRSVQRSPALRSEDPAFEDAERTCAG